MHQRIRLETDKAKGRIEGGFRMDFVSGEFNDGIDLGSLTHSREKKKKER